MAGDDTQLVALSFHQIFKVVDRVEPGVDLDSVDSGIDEGIGLVGGMGGYGDVRIHRG